MSNEVSDKLINLLREFNELDSETKRKVFVQAGITDSDFDRLRIDVVNLEDDIEANIKDNQTMDDLMSAWTPADILVELLKDETLDHDELNRCFRMSDRDDEMVVMKLVSFDELTVESQQFAIKAHKAVVKLSDKEQGEKRPNITSDECREELSRHCYNFFTDGHRYNKGDNL